MPSTALDVQKSQRKMSRNVGVVEWEGTENASWAEQALIILKEFCRLCRGHIELVCRIKVAWLCSKEWMGYICSRVGAVQSACVFPLEWMLLQGAASCKEHDAVLASMSWLRPLITLAFCPTFCPGCKGTSYLIRPQARGWQRRGEIK